MGACLSNKNGEKRLEIELVVAGDHTLMLKLVLGWFWCQGFANPQQWRWLKVEDEP